MNLIADYTNLFYPKKAGKVSPVFKDVSGVGMIGSGAVASGWNALSTTGKVAVGAGVGIVGTSIYDWLFGGKPASVNPVGGAGGSGGADYSKKSSEVVVSPPIVTTPTTNLFDYSTNIISNSPNSSIKKANSANATASVTPDFAVSPQISQSGGGGEGGAGGAAKGEAGADMTTLAVIAAVAILGAGYLSGRKGAKRK